MPSKTLPVKPQTGITAHITPTCLNCGGPIFKKAKTHKPQKFCCNNCRKEAHKHGGGARVQKWMREVLATLKEADEIQDERIAGLEGRVARLEYAVEK